MISCAVAFLSFSGFREMNIARAVGAAGEAQRVGDAGIRLDDIDHPQQNLIQRLERSVLIGQHRAIDAAVILLRERILSEPG